MSFGRSACEPLKPLRNEVASTKLGQFTVSRQLYVFPPVVILTTMSSKGKVRTSKEKNVLGFPSSPDKVSSDLQINLQLFQRIRQQWEFW